MKFFHNHRIAILLLALLNGQLFLAQEVIVEPEESTAVADTVKTVMQRTKIDGVVAVVGDFVVLDSDIDKEYLQLQARGVNTSQITRCELFGKLLEDKL
ncbi:MAG TPA: peptidylprolyl isomerase, partial [Aquaticitalea sp.]|nr:peptidylprolyl isomerase [Aquaticitalea sp.]